MLYNTANFPCLYSIRSAYKVIFLNFGYLAFFVKGSRWRNALFSLCNAKRNIAEWRWVGIKKCPCYINPKAKIRKVNVEDKAEYTWSWALFQSTTYPISEQCFHSYDNVQTWILTLNGWKIKTKVFPLSEWNIFVPLLF